jgi:hypothetical protein
MPGTHLLLSNNPLKDVDAKLADLQLDSSYTVDILYKNDHSMLATSRYKGYPIQSWQYDGGIIFVEGMVYNQNPHDLKKTINTIAHRFNRGETSRDLIHSFVNTADGEFIVSIFSQDNRLLVFNDYFGRLPYYYYASEKMCVFSREIKFILNCLPEIRFNMIGIIEFLMFEHSLYDDTFFSGVRWMRPATILEVDSTPTIHLKSNTASVQFDCVLRDGFRTKRQSIEVLRDGFYEALENRVNYLEREGYSIIADLSGGFDSRTVLAGLQKYSKEITYYSVNLSTNYPSQDETEWAEKVFRSFESPGKLVKIHNTYNFSPLDLGPLIYKTDSMVNLETTYVCYQDIQTMRVHEMNKSAVRMPGIGASDYIRKSPQYFSKSIAHGIKLGLYSRSTLHPKRICHLVDFPLEVYFDHINAYQQSYEEKTAGDQLKRYYFDYQFHFAQGAPEDRERHHFWTSPPMCGLPFMRTILSRFPNHWASPTYYIEFMRAIEPRSLDTPLYGMNLNLKSKIDVWLRGFYPKLQSAQHKLASVFPTLARTGKKFFFPATSQRLLNVDLIKYLYLQLGLTSQLIKLNAILQYLEVTPDRNLWLRVITLFLYLKELEIRFSQKIRI